MKKIKLMTVLILFSCLTMAQKAQDICALNIGSEVPSAVVRPIN